MAELFYGLALLACPLGMGVMMWMMMRGGNKHGMDPSPSGNDASELDQLRAEVAQLRAAQGTGGRSTSDQAPPVKSRSA